MIGKSDNPRETISRLAGEYRRTICNSYIAAANLIVDDIIEPAFTRKHITLALEMFQNKEERRPYKKHGNLPL